MTSSARLKFWTMPGTLIYFAQDDARHYSVTPHRDGWVLTVRALTDAGSVDVCPVFRHTYLMKEAALEAARQYEGMLNR